MNVKKITIKNKLQLKKEQPISRITNETVAEHRERILAGGRKFKYPHQYVRHRLVINAVIITVVALILIAAIGWWQLYPAQNTSDFMYRVTRVIPVPVAVIDGKQVRYSDYLMRYRSQQLWLQTQGQLGQKPEDNKRQLDYVKRDILSVLESDVYAAKRAKQLNISVSDQDVQSVIDEQRNTVTGRISQEVYDDSTRHLLGISPDEYRHILKQSLLRQKVGFAVDTAAKKRADQVTAALDAQEKGKKSLTAIVDEFKKKGISLEFGASGLVPKNNRDGGLSKVAVGLADGAVSGIVQSTNGDGYYFVQKVSSDSRQVSYQYIKIPLTTFDAEMKKLADTGKINEYISVAKVANQQQQ